MFNKILVANRGEIAVRVMQTARMMGIATAAIHTEPDAGAVHLTAADEAWPVGSYLDGTQILEVAKAHGVGAIHPGYGFLSENAAFAQACGDAGIRFIGPTPEVIRAMGDKIKAKEVMGAAGVPVVPGVSIPVRVEPGEVLGAARALGFPVMVKAAAGGGGKGMRLVRGEDTLLADVAAAAREAHAAFGDGRVFLEKYVERPRHVEFQIFGDTQGHAVHLFERECSIQRRHQKVVEESPSPALTPQLRAAMGEAAEAACRAIGYTNAGTVEFILDAEGHFYFLEVNTRLQVEHPVTELITGLDLVRAQIEVAAGRPLPFGAVEARGHAIECRVYAEDPANDFLPSIGTLQVYAPPRAPFVRVDSGVREGSEVTVHHDPMLCKLIVGGADRAEALARMRWALRNFAILGVRSNVAFLHALLSHPEFERGDLHTHFLREHEIAAPEPEAPPEAWLVAALESQRRQAQGGVEAVAAGPWAEAGAWRGV